MTKARKATYFLSDLHLGAKYFASPLDVERRVVRFLDSIKENAEAIYLVGDVLDYWFEYKYVVPRGFVRFFGKLAELADSGVKITWLIGNHDIWIFDYLPNELGIEVIDGVLTREIQGRKCFITHGDGVGELPCMFRFIRAMFRNKICQKLYAGLHPRWSVPFAYGWSNQNRGTHPAPDPYEGKGQEALVKFATDYQTTHPDIDYYIFGHRHIMLEEEIPGGAQVIILGEWIDQCSYARMANGKLTLHCYKEFSLFD
ncbi:MAG: UDP-2,3-diacylglucosamine diphosphatase [Prevotella sp.]|nr:UDP-2,3-diacylglucosamine diphosphatase [Prevotella sp.]MCM1074904.1 UDP-2,3-diacylglucosamine diphosphatase [Ruminococcus sp.]